MDHETSPEGLKRVLAEEKARGSRTRLPDEEVLEKKRLISEDIKFWFQQGNKKEFLKCLSEDYGLNEESDEYRRAVEAWNEKFQS